MSKIQILKGDIGKSITVQKICEANSFCFLYNKDYIPIGDCYLDSSISNIKELISSIKKWFKVAVTIPYDFFVIYTNNLESDLKELFEWLESSENIIDSRIIIVTCR